MIGVLTRPYVIYNDYNNIERLHNRGGLHAAILIDTDIVHKSIEHKPTLKLSQNHKFSIGNHHKVHHIGHFDTCTQYNTIYIQKVQQKRLKSG